MIQPTVFLDATDVADLVDTGTLAFSLGDQQFELHTRPRPTASPYAIRVTDDHLQALQASGEVAFSRPWGRLTIAMVVEVAR